MQQISRESACQLSGRHLSTQILYQIDIANNSTIQKGANSNVKQLLWLVFFAKKMGECSILGKDTESK